MVVGSTDSSWEKKVLLIDPSLVFRPEEVVKKSGWGFRHFQSSDDPKFEMVKETYMKMHTEQCVDYVKRKHNYWGKFDKFEATVLGLEKLNNLIDKSDPDVDIPNIVHAFQTAERIRQAHPKNWFHLTGLIHDLGKVRGRGRGEGKGGEEKRQKEREEGGE
ncbi:Inositol oxygenase-like [Homarus americanus]|uniref:Inositol oxygenase n=1 Tax=Homarus americanus TaxID=6706 RepID=A0A8J5MR34_HOMAM|nr:Inositol oxygenase-like [Homarus americanus]